MSNKETTVSSSIKRRVTARKHGGDDAASWAVLVDGRVMISGLTRSEVPYHRGQAQKILVRREKGE